MLLSKLHRDTRVRFAGVSRRVSLPPIHKGGAGGTGFITFGGKSSWAWALPRYGGTVSASTRRLVTGGGLGGCGKRNLRPLFELAPLEQRVLLAADLSVSRVRYAAEAEPAAVAVLAHVRNAPAGAGYAATIDWGDGSAATPAAVADLGVAATVFGRHAYPAAGQYTGTLTVAGPAGGPLRRRFRVTAVAARPAAAEPPVAADVAGDVNAGDAGSVARSLDVTPPSVTGVYVDGSAWTGGFRSHLAGQGLGSASLGYLVPAGSAQLLSLPWVNANTVRIQFSEDVAVTQDNLAVRGVNNAAYSFGGFSYDAAAHVGTWTLSAALPADRLVLDLAAAGPAGVTDLAGFPAQWDPKLGIHVT